MSTTGPMPEDRMSRPAPAPPGWYLDRATGQSRWWDGARWADDSTPEAYPASSNATPYFRPPPPDEKTAGIAGVLTFFFPGAGHLYLGDNQKAVPHLLPAATHRCLTVAEPGAVQRANHLGVGPLMGPNGVK